MEFFLCFCYFHVLELNEEVCLYSAIISGKIQQLVAQNDNANQHLENTSLRCVWLKMLILKFCTISKQELDLNTDEEENFLINTLCAKEIIGMRKFLCQGRSCINSPGKSDTHADYERLGGFQISCGFPLVT